MGVENARVHDYVKNAVDNHPWGSLIPRLDDAWLDVNVQRGRECGNLDLAAADHYLICRWLVCKYSPAIATVLSAMVGGYDGVYKGANAILEKFGGPDVVFRTSNCAATPFSPLVIAWAQTGISDGSLDCTWSVWQSNPKIAVPNYPLGFLNKLF